MLWTMGTHAIAVPRRWRALGDWRRRLYGTARLVSPRLLVLEHSRCAQWLRHCSNISAPMVRKSCDLRKRGRLANSSSLPPEARRCVFDSFASCAWVGEWRSRKRVSIGSCSSVGAVVDLLLVPSRAPTRICSYKYIACGFGLCLILLASWYYHYHYRIFI